MSGVHGYAKTPRDFVCEQTDEHREFTCAQTNKDTDLVYK